MTNISIDSSEASINRFFDRKLDKVLPNNDELKKALTGGKRLRFYMGADVTAPRMHIGHIIPFLKMQQLQRMGHEIIFLIGDFTGMIGDPTDKSATRTKLSSEEVKINSEAFVAQIKNIFDFENTNNPPEIKYNSTWNSKLSFSDVLELASNFTVQQMLERDMFQKRLEEKKPIYLHEFLYPLIQGYDSVAMDVDGEFGGTDQTFNMLAGRTLLKSLNNKEKYVITCKLLLSNDGVNKMSKSIGNCIYLVDSPEEKFGKLMAIPDSLIIHYYELLSDLSEKQLQDLTSKLKTSDNPMPFKKELAFYVVNLLDGAEAAQKAKEVFERTVQHKEVPEDILKVTRGELAKRLIEQGVTGDINAKELLTALELTKSNSDAKRLILEGAVEFDEVIVTNPNLTIDLTAISLIKAGKRQWRKLIA